jgi:hypothetical protein
MAFLSNNVLTAESRFIIALPLTIAVNIFSFLYFFWCVISVSSHPVLATFQTATTRSCSYTSSVTMTAVVKFQWNFTTRTYTAIL